MGTSYRGVVLLKQNDAAYQIKIGGDDRQTNDFFHALVVGAGAYYHEDALGAVDVNGGQYHYLVAEASGGHYAALIAQRSGRRPEVCLFAGWLAAMACALKFRGTGAAVAIVAVQSLSPEPLSAPPDEIPVSRVLGPMVIPSGWCGRCGDHPMARDSRELFCETCRRLDKIHPHLLP